MRVDEARLNQFLDRIVGDLAASYGGVTVSIGHKLGLYKAMAGAGPLSAAEVASRANCAERYVREWLNSQAAAGYVVYHPSSRCYELTPEQAMILANEDSPVHFPPAFDCVASLWFDEDKVRDAFKTGKGVPWGERHHRLFHGNAAFFRNPYRGELVQTWLPALEGVQAKLEAGAKVADIGCGYGHSTIVMAEAFPNSRFHGYDTHPASIEAARRIAREAGVEDHTAFEVADAKSVGGDGFDLVCYFDCLHDMGDPVGAARHAREVMTEDGSVMLVEPYANDRVEDNLNPVGRLFYSASATVCCAHSLSEEVGAALGAQAGEKRLAEVFRKAGFSNVRRATATPFNLILEAKP